MRRGEPLKSNPETTRAWKRRSAEKAAQNRPVRSPLGRSAPESRPTGQNGSHGRLGAAPEPSASRPERRSGAGAVERRPRSDQSSLSRAVDRRSRRAVRKRSGGRCEVRIPSVCRGQATNYHHRQPRGMGGSSRPEINAPENYLHICGSGTTGCHGWIESNRDEARRRGWLVPRPTDPAAVPWLPHDGRTP